MNIRMDLVGDDDIKILHKISEMMSTIDGVCFLDVFGEKMKVINANSNVSSQLNMTIQLESVRKEYTKEELIKIARQKFHGIWPWVSGGNVLSVTFGVTPDDEEFSFSTQISGEWGDWHGHSKVICSKEEYLNYE